MPDTVDKLLGLCIAVFIFAVIGNIFKKFKFSFD